MSEILLFVKDFELGSKLSSTCIDQDRQVEFSDENTDPTTFREDVKMAVVDMDENVFSFLYRGVGDVSNCNTKQSLILSSPYFIISLSYP